MVVTFQSLGSVVYQCMCHIKLNSMICDPTRLTNSNLEWYYTGYKRNCFSGCVMCYSLKKIDVMRDRYPPPPCHLVNNFLRLKRGPHQGGWLIYKSGLIVALTATINFLTFSCSVVCAAWYLEAVLQDIFVPLILDCAASCVLQGTFWVRSVVHQLIPLSACLALQAHIIPKKIKLLHVITVEHPVEIRRKQ